MSHTGNAERHFVLEEIESCLKARLETPVDQGAPEEFINREYPEMRSEIARHTAALIQKARHGVVKDLARLIRTAVSSWRLLQEVEEKSKRAGPSCLHRDHNDLMGFRTATPAPQIDSAWRDIGRLFVIGYRTTPPCEIVSIDNEFDVVLGSLHSITIDDRTSWLLNAASMGKSMGGMGFGKTDYNPIFFGHYLSIRDEWRTVAAVLDHLTLCEPELDDLQLLREFANVLGQQIQLRGRVKVLQGQRGIAGADFEPTLYELVRSYTLSVSLSPPERIAAIFERTSYLGFEANDYYKRRSRRSASPGRKRRTYPRRGSPGPPGCAAYSQRCLKIRGHTICRPADNPRGYRPSAELLRGHRLRVLDYLSMACA
jgi:hypothetical protein